VPYSSRQPSRSSPGNGTTSLVSAPPVTSAPASQREDRHLDRQRWTAPLWGVAMFLLFFVGTFLTMRAVDRGGDGGSAATGIVAGSCVAKNVNGTLTTVDCSSRPAQVVTQIVPAGRSCADPHDIQHFFAVAAWSSICVRPA
jgi:hypothetical protein